MKCLILLVFCLGRAASTDKESPEVTVITSGLTTTFGSELNKETIGPIEDNNSNASRERVRRLAEQTGIGLRVNEQDVINEDNIIRLCSLNDRMCIRNFFVENSQCTIAFGPISDPIYLAQKTESYPSVNITSTFANYTIRGLSSANIIELYFNTVTKKLVLAFQIRNVNMTSRNAFFSYHRLAREPIVLNDRVTAFFNSITITVILPMDPDIQLNQAECHAFVPDASPDFTIGPKLYESKNPTVNYAYESIYEQLPAVVREIFLFKAALIAATFIQDSICDFGVKLYSV